MGGYYRNRNNELVKAVSRAMDNETGSKYIVYCEIRNGGYASEPLIMPEQKFIDNYARPAG